MSQQKNERNELEAAIEGLKKEIASLKVTNSKQKARIDDLMEKLDKGVSSGWSVLTGLEYPSTLDYNYSFENVSQ